MSYDPYAYNQLCKEVVRRLLAEWDKPEEKQHYNVLVDWVREWIEDNFESVQDTESIKVGYSYDS